MPPDMMNLSINGQSQVPPGFRFHPTEEELLHYYLRKKVADEKIDLDVIREVDLNKLEPWDIQEKCRIGSTRQSDWYFFSHKDKKYPAGTRTNRATAAGFWKATGRDKVIYSGFRRIGLRKTLVFYKGRAPHGQKSDWIMHEYRLDESPSTDPSAMNPMIDQSGVEEGWVVCRVFRKKNFQKTLDHSPKSSSSTSMDWKLVQTLNPTSNLSFKDTPSSVQDQILLYMGGNSTCKTETDQPRLPFAVNPPDGCATVSSSIKQLIDPQFPDLHDWFMHLPRLESPTMEELTHHIQDQLTQPLTVGDWAVFDELVASQLNGQSETLSSSAWGSS